jgi:hypothetical protein
MIKKTFTLQCSAKISLASFSDIYYMQRYGFEKGSFWASASNILA